MMRQISINAYAKVNLGLDVLRRRGDGYHELRMIMQTLQLHDTLTLQLSGRQTLERGAEETLQLSEETTLGRWEERRGVLPQIRIMTDAEGVPVNENNLCWKAANLLMEEFPDAFSDVEQLSITLEKRIPMAAGLAGGSADAAAVLIGLNELLLLGLSQEELMHRGVRIGADVPYCILKGTALAEGIGEILTPLTPPPECYLVLVKPGIQVSTAFVYGNLKADQLTEHPEIDAQIDALKRGDLRTLAEKMGNVLETVTVPAYPVIEQIRTRLLSLGAAGARMSGSGPTVFGIFTEIEKAEEAAGAMKQETPHEVIVTGLYP